jgi:hypothetical protein
MKIGGRTGGRDDPLEALAIAFPRQLPPLLWSVGEFGTQEAPAGVGGLTANDGAEGSDGRRYGRRNT